MTAAELITTATRQGIKLTAEGNTLRVAAPAGTMTPELREALRRRKQELLLVLERLAGMRATVGHVPMPCAVAAAVGGPGRCFSCGDPLGHPQAYGRCVPCSIACELFYRESRDGADHRQEPISQEDTGKLTG